MQKFIYCVWNKFWAEEEDEIVSNTTYILTSFHWELNKKTIEAMLQQKEEELQEKNSDQEWSLASLEWDFDRENRPTIANR